MAGNKLKTQDIDTKRLFPFFFVLFLVVLFDCACDFDFSIEQTHIFYFFEKHYLLTLIVKYLVTNA